MPTLIPLSRSKGPLYQQIYQGLRRAILSGTFQAGEQLPSTRSLAEEHGVSRTVVVLAYEQLLAEGYASGRGGSGTYVSSDIPRATATKTIRCVKPTFSPFGAAAMNAAGDLQFPNPPTPPLPYDFAYGRSDLQIFPFEMWRRILLRHARRATVREFDYGDPAGSFHLREAIAAHLRRSRAVVCDASQVIVVSGSQQALDLIARVLIQRGDRVVIEDPSYQGTREIFRVAGARLHATPVDRRGVDPQRLPPQARLAIVTPSHQYPSGAILPLPRRVAILDWAKRSDAIVVEDDYDGEFRYDGQPLESLQGLDTEGRVVYVGTFSRTMFSALRIGYLVLPSALVQAFVAAKWLCDRHTPTLEQETLAEFISSGMYDRHLRRVRRKNAARRRTLLESIARHVGKKADLCGDGAGAHVVLWLTGKKSEQSAIDRAREKGVAIYGISRYFVVPPKRTGLLLGYSRLSERQIEEGVRRLGTVL